MNQNLWRGTVDEETTVFGESEEYEVGDTVISGQSEILTEKYRDKDIVLDQKPWHPNGSYSRTSGTTVRRTVCTTYL